MKLFQALRYDLVCVASAASGPEPVRLATACGSARWEKRLDREMFAAAMENALAVEGDLSLRGNGPPDRSGRFSARDCSGSRPVTGRGLFFSPAAA